MKLIYPNPTLSPHILSAPFQGINTDIPAPYGFYDNKSLVSISVLGSVYCTIGILRIYSNISGPQ
jgi:hypothetical protein